jgi:hypothetical protein
MTPFFSFQLIRPVVISLGIVYTYLRINIFYSLEGFIMKILRYISILSLTLVLTNAWAGSNALNHYKTLTLLDGD